MLGRLLGKEAILLRKSTLVAGQHPVHTLTFATPTGAALGVYIHLGGVVKIFIPGARRPLRSYSVSAERPGEFEVTFKLYRGGRGSGYLNGLLIGDAVRFRVMNNCALLHAVFRAE